MSGGRTVARPSAPPVAARDEAFARLVALEAQSRALAPLARDGDAGARRELAGLRRQLTGQTVLAADLDVACDLAGLRPRQRHTAPAARPEAVPADGRARRLAALCAERNVIATEIEQQVAVLAALCRRMVAVQDTMVSEGLAPGPVLAELNRFRDRFCFYLDGMLDFMTGTRGLAGHPAYRRLTEVMLDGDTILAMFRRATAAPGTGAGPSESAAR